VLKIDLRPDLPLAEITARLARAKAGQSLANTLRKSLHLSPLETHLLREAGEVPAGGEALAARIKSVPVTLTGVQGLARAISSVGGIALSEVDGSLRLRALPGVFVAGEMLDWEAPTGGYLLQAAFATGAWAAKAILAA
jgi:predicted flavoprotein YhiN